MNRRPKIPANDARTEFRHWMDFILGAMSGLLMFILLFYVTTKAFVVLFNLLQTTFGPLPLEFFQTILTGLSDYTIFVALALAIALSVINITIRWDDVSPKSWAKWEHSRRKRKIELR